jgi:hypothetical protein
MTDRFDELNRGENGNPKGLPQVQQGAVVADDGHRTRTQRRGKLTVIVKDSASLSAQWGGFEEVREL